MSVLLYEVKGRIATLVINRPERRNALSGEVILARYYRDSRLGSIGGGADEIMLGIIAKMDGLMVK